MSKINKINNVQNMQISHIALKSAEGSCMLAYGKFEVLHCAGVIIES
jgi:hypothetical protein